MHKNINRIFISSLVLFVLSLSSRLAYANTVNTDIFTPKLSVADFMAEADLADAEISPNGRYLAVVLSKDKVRFVVIKDLEQEGSPTIGTFGDKVIRPASVRWANDERLLIRLWVPFNVKKVVKKSKEDDFNIYDYRKTARIISVDIHAKNPVVLMEGESVGTISHYLSDDPEHVLMPYFLRGRYTLDKVNVYTGKAKKHIRAGKYTYKVFTDGKGNPKYRLDHLRIAKIVEVHEFNDEGEWNQVKEISYDKNDDESDDDDELILFGLTNDFDLVYRHRNEETGFYEILELGKNDGDRKIIASSPNQDVRGLITELRSDKIIGYTTQKDLVRHHYFDEKRQANYDSLVEKIGNNNLSLRWPAIAKTNAIVFTSGPDNPGHYALYDLKTKKLKSIDNRYAKLNFDTLGIPAVTNVKMRDGEKIRVYILLPPNYQEGVAAPMVVYPHGGPHVRDSARYEHFTQFLATRGYIVVQPNFRGSSGYGLEFEKAGYRQWGGLMQDDLTDTVNFMIKSGFALKEKVCIVGGSYGGYAALMGVIKTPDLYRCSVSMNGVTHLKKQMKYDIKAASKKRRDDVKEYWYERLGRPKSDSEMLDANSPALRAKEVKVPVLIIAGEEDKVVPRSQSTLMVRALKRAKKDVEYIELKWGGHSIFQFIDHRETVYTKVEEFLARHLM